MAKNFTVVVKGEKVELSTMSDDQSQIHTIILTREQAASLAKVILTKIEPEALKK